MEKIVLGESGLKVSRVCLGTMHYGLDAMPEDAAFRQMDNYLQAGGNFIDTAQVYNNWVPGETSRSEKIIGRYLRRSGARGRVVLCSKGGHPPIGQMDRSRLDPDSLREDLSSSLDNLKTDRIDLYLLHRDDPSVPVGEILGFLEERKDQGLIASYGFSNWTLPRAEAARDYARRNGLHGFSVNQILWSLARINEDRLEDKTLVCMSQAYCAFHQSTGMALMAYTSQAKGYFSRRFLGAPVDAGLQALYGNAENEEILKRLSAYCRAHGCDPSATSLRWFMSRPFPAVPVVSLSNPRQMEAMLAALRPGLPPLPAGLPDC